jgi:Tfp pilus assembly protein PilO
MTRFAPWRRRAALWLVPLLLVAANLIWLTLFQSGFSVRAAALDSALERARSENSQAVSRKASLERLWTAAADNREQVERLYHEGFSTQRERLTETIRLVKDLASRAGLEPQSISYPEDSLNEYGLVRRSFVFSVEGTYSDLRTFLHLLELAPAFVTVNQIAVGDTAKGRGLSISLRLSTFFEAIAGDDAAPAGGPPGARIGGGS